MILKNITAIKAIYAQVAPNQSKNNPILKATAAEIADFEAAIGAKLPTDYTTFLAHNDFAFSFLGSYECLALTRVMENWAMMNSHKEAGTFDDGRVEYHEEHAFGNWDGQYIKRTWWSRFWIPFAADSCGNMLCIDLDPDKNGKKFQLIAMEIQDGQGPYFEANYRDFSHFLKITALALQNKKYDISEYWDGSPMIQLQ